jgi:hypothetical protein
MLKIYDFECDVCGHVWEALVEDIQMIQGCPIERPDTHPEYPCGGIGRRLPHREDE